MLSDYHEAWMFEEKLARMTLLSFVASVCFGPTWLIV